LAGCCPTETFLQHVEMRIHLALTGKMRRVSHPISTDVQGLDVARASDHLNCSRRTHCGLAADEEINICCIFWVVVNTCGDFGAVENGKATPSFYDVIPGGPYFIGVLVSKSGNNLYSSP